MNRILIVGIIAGIGGGAIAGFTDRGTIKNCGDAAHSFQGWWNPDPIVLFQNLTFHIDLVPAVDCTTMNTNVSVTYGGFPIYSGQVSRDCSQLQLPVCPMKKGKHAVQEITLPFNFDVPQGDYVIQANVTNEKGDWLLCAIIDTKITTSLRKQKVRPMLLQKAKPFNN